MKQFNKYILFSFLSLAAVGCINEEEITPVDKNEAAETVKMTFTASIEDNAETKTMLGESDEYGYRQILWQPGDSIGLGYYSTMNKFINVKEENSTTAIFEGEYIEQEVYYAIYPYQENQYISWDPGYQFYLPAVQKYAEGTFAPESNVMVGKGSRGEELKFTSVCGILVIKLTGEEKIQSISLTGKTETGENAKLSGKHTVKIDWVENPVLVADQSAGTMITLDCGEGVQLDPVEPTSFYLVLPPATYSSFTLTIGTTDGKVMLKEGKNLDITRAEYRTASSLPFAAEVAFDLCSKGTANCYIVSEAGLYTFDASTIGNGEFGLTNALNNSAYHTTDATINPDSAELLWSDGRGSIGGITYDKNSHRVNFVATGTAGNSVIAAKDADGKILWSWHIWATDQPVEHRYINDYGEFTVLDRNLGALRNNGGSSDVENRESIGAMYQWGRKDPFYAVRPENSWDWTMFYTRKNTRLTTEESIELPTTLAGYDDWNKNGSYNLWSTTGKTIYDPCPTGYRVAVTDVFRSFTKNGNDIDRGTEINYSGSFDKGFEFYYDGSNTAWYPATTYHWCSNWGPDYAENSSYIWSANQSAFYFYYNDDYECSIRLAESHSHGHAFPVRCMKDDATASLIVKINDMSEVSSSSATASGKVSTYGDLEVTNSGFVVGNHNGVTITDGTVFKSNAKTGQITAQITELAPLTRYYIKAFATTAEGTTYSEAISFLTTNNEGVIDLSAEGKANSYIVKPAYSTYSFKMVKGNSNESVGDVDIAEILWETYNTSDQVTPNSVIASVDIDSDNVKFTLPENAVPGNAVIAVKDINGIILWSWHIWVVDFDPEVTKQTYMSGAVMMDRNLGALHIADYDPRTHGLYYQWGRKDPFQNPVSSWDLAKTSPDGIWTYAEKISDYNYSIQNPTVSLTGTNWNNDNTLWGTDKTIYDPCPAGWKVPEGGPGVWNGIDLWYYGSWGMYGALTKVDAPYSVPTAYYSSGGYLDAYSNIFEYESASYSSSYATSEHNVYAMRISDSFSTSYTKEKDLKMPIRCMKEPEMTSDENEGYTESDDYEW